MKNKSILIKNKILEKFDLVGIIEYQTYCKYLNIKPTLSDVNSLIVVGKNYYRSKEPKAGYTPAMFARGSDYHQVMQKLFNSLKLNLEGNFYVDASPINEKTAGFLAGLGFFGHNNILVNLKYGNFIFIGTFCTSAEFDVYDKHQIDNKCLECRLCEKACPTKALSPIFKKENCKSYITQKFISGIPNIEETYNNDVVLGCDICQKVCPVGLRLESDVFFDGEDDFNLTELLNMTKDEFSRKYKNKTYNYLSPLVIAKNIMLRMIVKKDYDEIEKNKEKIFKDKFLKELYLRYGRAIEKSTLNVVLFEPEIPQNTGNIMRTCIGTDVRLHLIKPLGFSLDEASLKRAGLDYIENFKYFVYENLEEFFAKNHGLYFYLSRYGKKPLSNFDFSRLIENIYLFFGKESTGLPHDLLKENFEQTFRIPMNSKIRSLNLSNCAAISIYEVLRQFNYPDLSFTEPNTLKGEDFLK